MPLLLAASTHIYSLLAGCVEEITQILESNKAPLLFSFCASHALNLGFLINKMGIFLSGIYLFTSLHLDLVLLRTKI